jgi:ribosomal protein L16 Arg81 hydroxylase
VPSLKALFPGSSAVGSLEWLRRPNVRHGPLERLGALAEIDEIADFRCWPHSRDLVISAILERGGVHRIMPVDTFQAARLYGVGATLSFQSAHRWHPALRRWIHALAGELGVPENSCSCTVYVSPARCGVSKHFDNQHEITVQVIGTKRWRIAPNEHLVNPLETCVVTAGIPRWTARHSAGRISRTMPRGAVQVVLRPGSTMSIPIGYWHSTQAIEPSVSITFGVAPPTWFELAGDAIVGRLTEGAEWREPAWGITGTPPQRDAARKRLASLLAGLSGTLERLSASAIVGSAPDEAD